MSAAQRNGHGAGDSRSGASVAHLPALDTLAHNRDLIDHVQRMTLVLTDGDFDALVVWRELARRAGTLEGEPRPLSLRALVEATAIPRETLRRKLCALEAAGRVARVGRGWTLCPESFKHVSPDGN